MIWIINTGAPPEPGEDQMESGIRQGKAHRSFSQGIVCEDSHRSDRQHLQKGENTSADVVISVKVMVHGTVEPCPPDNDKKENKCADAGYTDVPRQCVREFGNDDHIDQVIEQLQKRNAALFRTIACGMRRLPPAAKADSF